MAEYDCQRCGIRVIEIVGEPRPEKLYCPSCRFIESIEDPETKAKVAEAIDRTNPMFQGEEGG